MAAVRVASQWVTLRMCVVENRLEEVEMLRGRHGGNARSWPWLYGGAGTRLNRAQVICACYTDLSVNVLPVTNLQDVNDEYIILNLINNPKGLLSHPVIRASR